MDMFTVWGGYNYGEPYAVEADSLADAARHWYDRYSSNGLRRVDGYFYPCYGDCQDDEYVVVDFNTDETLTRREVLAMFA